MPVPYFVLFPFAKASRSNVIFDYLILFFFSQLFCACSGPYPSSPRQDRLERRDLHRACEDGTGFEDGCLIATSLNLTLIASFALCAPVLCVFRQ